MTKQTPRSNRIRIILTSILLVIVILVVAFFVIRERIQNAPIPFGNPSGEIAFVSNRDGDWDLFILDTDGTLRNLTGDGSEKYDIFPSWAIDSNMLNFLTNRDGELGPGQVTPQGEDLRTLTIGSAIIATIREGRFDWDPAWSPNGDQVLLSSLRDFNLELYLSDLEGENFRRLTDDGARDWFAAWSPDGTQIIFNSDRSGKEAIYSINVATDEITQLTNHERASLHAFWSLDGTKIVYINQDNNLIEDMGILDFYIMDADGSNSQPLGEEIFAGDPMWSPDGTTMIYMSNEDGNWSLYSKDANGENIIRLTDGEGSDLFPVWRP